MRTFHVAGGGSSTRGEGSYLRLRSSVAVVIAIGSLVTGHASFGSIPTASASTPIPNLTPSTSGIHLGLMFNWQVTTAPGETKGAEVGVDDYVFGAQESAQNTNIPAAGVHHTAYYPFGRDRSYMPNEIGYMKTNHPDWIVYRSDRSTPAWYNSDDATNGYQVPIDVTNPAIQSYMMSNTINAYITIDGYQGVAFDQGETINGTYRAGVYKTATTLSSSAPAGATTIKTRMSLSANTYIAVGNGTDMEYLQVVAAKGHGPYTLSLNHALAHAHSSGEWVGSWVQQYSGNKLDTAYRSATIQAFGQIVQRIKSVNPSATVSINDQVDLYDNGTDQQENHAWDYWRDLVPYVDVIVNECSLTNCGDAPYYVTDATSSNGLTNPWLTTIQDFQWAAAQGKAVMIVGYEPYQVTSGMTATNTQARFDLQWNLANYLLARGSYTYLAWRGGTQTNGEVYQEPEYTAAVGAPTDNAYQSQGVWVRDYSNGLAVVNPSNSSPQTITLPSNTYQDLYGNPTTSYTLSPHSGLVLLRAGGTSAARAGGQPATRRTRIDRFTAEGDGS